MVIEEAATESRPNLLEYYEYLTLEGRFMVPRLLEYLKDLKSNIVTEDSLNQLVKVKTSYPLLPFYGQALGPKDKEGLIQWYLDYFLPAVEGSVQYLYLDSEKGIITTGKGINVENALVTKGVKQKRVAFNPELFAQRTPKALAYRNEIANKVRIFFKSLSLNNKMCLFPHIFWGTITHKGRQNNVEENRAKFLTEEQLNQEILNALDNLVSRKLSHQYGPRYPAKSFLTGDHTIVVDKETTDLVASEKVESAYNRLTRVFPKFLFFPAGAQLALLDMQYNLGEGKFNQYQNLIRIVNGYNFEINNVSESFCRPYHPFYETLRDKEKTNLTQLVNFGGFSTLAKEQSPDWRILAYEMEDPGGGEVLELSEFSHPHCTNFYFWRKRPPLPSRNLATFILFILAAEWQNTDFQKINTSEAGQKPQKPDEVQKDLDRLRSKINNSKKHLKDGPHGELQAALKERGGEVVCRKMSGEPFDHINEVQETQQKLKKTIELLKKNVISNPKASPKQIQEAEDLLSHASKLLDHSEGFVPSIPFKMMKGR